MNPPAATGFDVFLSAPMAGLRSAAKYRAFRAEMLTVVAALESCGLTVFFAGRDLESPDQFDEQDASVVRDIEALNASRYMLMIYPERVVSSVLVEAGYALAKGMKAVYFVRDVKHLPFLLRHLDRVHPLKIYEYETIDRVVTLIRKHRAKLFEPWREATTQAGIGTVSEPIERLVQHAPRPGEKVGPYTLVDELGEGSFGAVWLAERRTTLATTRFALKFPHAVGPGVADSIRREATVWVQASGHPNVLPVIEAECYDGRLVIVSPYAPNGSLADWMRTNGGKAPTHADAVRLTAGILAGLAHLHGRRLLHRDMKPANVLLEGSTPRIADFGLARTMAGSSGADQTHSIGGTPAYMAPEAWTGERSEAADVWSVGVIFYELLAGRRPFPGVSAAEIRKSLDRGTFDPLPVEFPAELTAILKQALQANPAERYASATAMLDELTQLG